MLKTSALQLLRVANQHLINSVDRTKIIYLYSPTDAAPQFLQKLPPPPLITLFIWECRSLSFEDFSSPVVIINTLITGLKEQWCKWKSGQSK